MTKYRRRRLLALVIALIITGAGAFYESVQQDRREQGVQSETVLSPEEATQARPAAEILDKLEVKGRAPKTGYSRTQFSDGWGEMAGCDVRNYVLQRDMTSVVTRSEADCTVMQGLLDDPYTGKRVMFVRGPSTSDDVQVDHVVALSNAWQTGAQLLSAEERYEVHNDPLNLLAVDGPANQQKGDADAATWLPPNKQFRCRYVARQIAVKYKYQLWVTPPEREAILRVLQSCPQQVLPVVTLPQQ